MPDAHALPHEGFPAPDNAPQSPYDDAPLGMYGAFDTSPNGKDDFIELSSDQKKIVEQLALTCSRTDVASRRFEVEICWRARWFEQGWQRLLPRTEGGWQLPGSDSRWGVLATLDSASIRAVNIYGRDKDIVSAAISREVPKVRFFPRDPDDPVAVRAAAERNKFKYVFEKSSHLRELLEQLAYHYWVDDRACFYTRPVADAQRFGLDAMGNPRVRVIATLFGKLEHKVPIQNQDERGMHFVQLFEEIDEAKARGMFPWIADQITPGNLGVSEVQLDRIARMNTRLGLYGSYVTSDSMERSVTIQRNFFRPEIFFDRMVPKNERDFFLENFPKGMLAVYASTTFAYARNEGIDDSLAITHALPGNGQHRRALGSNEISIQQRLNDYCDIMDDFFRKTIPRRHYDADAFDAEALKTQDNSPGESGAFLRQPGVPASDMIIIEPTPTPQPSLPDFIDRYFGQYAQELTGAVPSLFGAPSQTSESTPVGTAALQRDQALARIGVAWKNAQDAFAKVFQQAAEHTKNSVKEEIGEALPSGGMVMVNPAALEGDVVCYPEYDASLPESWDAREGRYMELIAAAPTNPFMAEALKDTRNIRSIATNVRMAELHLQAADSAQKQAEETEILLKGAPIANPDYARAETLISTAPDPRAAQMAQQALSQVPPMLSSVPVAQDASENHAVEAQACFEAMNSSRAQDARRGTPEQQEGFQNLYLHWKQHMEMAKKLAAENQPLPPPPRPSLPFKELPPQGKSQIAARAGVHLPPQAFAQDDLIKTQHKVAEKVAAKAIPDTLRRVTNK